MTRLLAIAAVLATASAANANSINGFITGPVTDGGNDTYRVSATNNFASDVTSFDFRIEGQFVNTFPLPLTFNPGAEGIAGFPDSFFVFPLDYNPAGDSFLGRGVEDTSTVLAAIYTTPGNRSLLPAGATAVLAVVVVPEGTPFGPANIVRSRAAVAGAFQDIVFIPEASTAILVSLALVGFATRRT